MPGRLKEPLYETVGARGLIQQEGSNDRPHFSLSETLAQLGKVASWQVQEGEVD
jgi:hypothetical protein